MISGPPNPGLPLAFGAPPLSATGVLGGAGEAITVEMRHGRMYAMSLAGLGASAALLVMFGLIAASTSSDLSTVTAVLSFFGLLLVTTLAVAVYYKADCTLIVDSGGVRLLRAGRTVRDIPWADISRFRFGAVSGIRPFVDRSTLFWVHARGRYRGLSILESAYRIPSGSLWNAALLTAELAQARGIPVVRKDGLIRDFGP